MFCAHAMKSPVRQVYLVTHVAAAKVLPFTKTNEKTKTEKDKPFLLTKQNKNYNANKKKQ